MQVCQKLFFAVKVCQKPFCTVRSTAVPVFLNLQARFVKNLLYRSLQKNKTSATVVFGGQKNAGME